eukprot:NODE_59_length_28102_cov_0.971110.p25 type:complete len:108 gc:universal NODE_59_length_28102_cov_0.971110:15774-16097(+)
MNRITQSHTITSISFHNFSSFNGLFPSYEDRKYSNYIVLEKSGFPFNFQPSTSYISIFVSSFVCKVYWLHFPGYFLFKIGSQKVIYCAIWNFLSKICHSQYVIRHIA